MSWAKALFSGRFREIDFHTGRLKDRGKSRRIALRSWAEIKARHRRVRAALRKPQRGPVVILKGTTNQQRIRSSRGK